MATPPPPPVWMVNLSNVMFKGVHTLWTSRLAWATVATLLIGNTAYTIEWHWPTIHRKFVPTPPVPVPPKPPQPTPTPPTPDPTPNVLTKLRVFFINESSDAAQAGAPEVWGSTAIRTYLSSRCTTDTDGRPAWRFWDKDVTIASDTPDTLATWKIAQNDTIPLPKIVIFNGTTFIKSIALPKTEADTLSLLQQYGGH